MREQIKAKHWVFLTVFFVGMISIADITSAVRNSKAVVHYDFEDDFTSMLQNDAPVVFQDKSNIGAKLNLRWYGTDKTKIEFGKDSSNDGFLRIRGSTIIRSIDYATKITSECRKPGTTGLTIEAEIESNETVERRTGEYPESNNPNFLQPLRIVSMSKDFTNRGNNVNINFALGQVYNMGDRFLGALTNPVNQNLFAQPVTSSATSVLIDGLGRKATSYKQKVIFTVNKLTGFANLYLTDRNGNLYPAVETRNGFNGGTPGTYFDKWISDAYLNVGNDYISSTSILTQPENFQDYIGSDPKSNNPNRYWKGKMYRLAIYCEALSKDEVFGSAYQIVKNELFPIVNVPRTENLLKASEIYERLTGTKTPIYNPLLTQMEQRLNVNDGVGAAALVTENPSFYNIVVRNFAAKMSNRDETINYPLNDFTATVIGAVRDDISAKELLSGDFFYQGDPTKSAVPSDDIDDILRSNNHYEALESGNFDLKAVLMKRKQILLRASSATANNSTNNNNINNITFEAVDNSWAAGLLTTRQWAMSHMVAGTNRRAAEFTFREFLCMPIENMADASGPEDVIGRDIDRNPGGSRAKFTTSCRACHTVLDGFRPAFAHMTFSNDFLKHSSLVPNSTAANANEDNSIVMRIHPDAPTVSRKMNHNEETFRDGRILRGDEWVNNANSGTNKIAIGWGPRVSGKGTNEFGKAIAESKAFPRCMAKRVFFTVCKREAGVKEDGFIKTVAEEFSKPERNYNLKYLFQKIVSNELCLGGK